MGDRELIICEIEETITDIETLNELINALSLSFSSPHSQLTSKQNEMAVSSIYMSLKKSVTRIRGTIDLLYKDSKK